MQRPAARAMGPLRHFASRTRRLFGLGRRGAVALITAVCAPALLMIVGFGADYGYASYLNQCLARAADAATLGSVSQTAATAVGGYSKLSDLQTYGTNYFKANIAALSLTGVNFNLNVVSDGSGGVIATSTYTYNVPTTFSNFIGVKTMPLSGGARTTARPLTYVNYYILVDASQSMGIASTPAGMTTLYNAIAAAGNGTSGEKGCVFGCHALGNRNDGGIQTMSNLQTARNNNVELRIDAAKTAVKTIIAQAQTIASTTQNIKFALYTIQKNPADNTNIHTVATLSNNYQALQNAASTIDLGPNTNAGLGDTDFPAELSTFYSNVTSGTTGLTANGSGASATSPLNYFFIVTDGVTDTPSNYCNWTHCTGPLDSNQCTPFKKLGTVGVIYTTYAKLWQDNNPSSGQPEAAFAALVTNFYDQISPALQACATSLDFFFEASDGPDIIAQTQALFQRTQPSSARITQ